MDSSFNADKPDDDLSAAFDTEILAKREMIPEGFANTPSSRTDIPVEVIGGERYLRVDQSANPSSAKKLINPERNALSDATIEATGYLKAWWDEGRKGSISHAPKVVYQQPQERSSSLTDRQIRKIFSCPSTGMTVSASLHHQEYKTKEA